MIGNTGAVGVGVVKAITGGGAGGGILATDIVNETFVYDGIDNVFMLASPALAVINVYIDNATFADQVPAGATNSVTVDPILILAGNQITIQYIK